jgi:hypothetical protein
MQKPILKLSLIFIGLSFLSLKSAHPLKATSTRLSYNNQTKTVTIEVEVFRDDFQNALNKEYNSRYDLFRFYNQKEPLDIINKFFNKYVSIHLNKKAIVLNCTSAENSDDKNSFVFKMEISKIDLVGKQKLNITNTLLFNHFPNQNNVVIVSIPNRLQKIIQFNKDHFSEILDF